MVEENNDDDDQYEPKKKRRRITAHDDGDDRQYFSRLKDFYANRKAPTHEQHGDQDEVEVGQGLWMPTSVWDRLFK